MTTPGEIARERALVASPRPRNVGSSSLLRRLLPPALRKVQDDLETRLARIPTAVNEFGVDPFGYQPAFAAQMLLPLALTYRHWLRVETTGIERVPAGRVLLIANHGGNTFAWDAAMLTMSMLLDADPPRVVRGMAEYYLPTLPFFGTMMHRMGSVVGTPSNCAQLLDRGEAIMVFPEGERGFVKPYTQRYQLQRFGLGFLRLALETDTPIVPVGIVGSEEQSPGLLRSHWLGKLVGAPVAPITLTFPWLGLASFLPLPVKFRLHFGVPLRFDGDANDEDAVIEKKVDVVKDA
ncbi:MAG: lysophospholipid acyltransferase family protein, partial [Proteobacteria bacterium]|nr:lysophospholipid acyltransferase family protein [Pseudomonadota bacterium]